MKIGIDPDCDKSGVAILQNGELSLKNFDLIELYKFLFDNRPELVVIEASWLISYNYSAMKSKGSLSKLLSIANSAGANHEVGRQIEKICIKLGIKYKLQRPIKLINKKKITHEQFVTIWQVQKLCPGLKKTNQEQRDAALLIL